MYRECRRVVAGFSSTDYFKHKQEEGQSTVGMRQLVLVNTRMPQKFRGSEGQFKGQRFTGPGAVLEDKGQLDTTVHHSPVIIVSHPSPHAATALPKY